jgi:diguanylate cyclase (GGDEF)-like protein
MRMLNALELFVVDRSSIQIFWLGLVLIGVIGAVDHFTGNEISFSIFYLLPIIFVTWYAEQKVGYLICLISALVWFMIDFVSKSIYSHHLIPYWNAIVRLGFFFMVAYLLGGLKAHLQREQELASTDDLTGLYNARAFKEEAGKQLDLSRRYHHSFALAFIDLDDFKKVNDSWGHTEGDNVLRMVGSTLRRVVRSTDTVGRLGGDECSVFMPEMSVSSARVAFSKLHRELQLEAQRNGWPIGFSIGVAVFAKLPATLDDAVSMADSLMYRAKTQDKNSVIYEVYA